LEKLAQLGENSISPPVFFERRDEYGEPIVYGDTLFFDLFSFGNVGKDGGKPILADPIGVYEVVSPQGWGILLETGRLSRENYLPVPLDEGGLLNSRKHLGYPLTQDA